MGKKSRGRSHSSASRGRGQNSSLNRIRKGSSPAGKTPAIVISSALDQNKLSPLYVPRSPIRTRAATGNAKQQSATASGKPQQPPGDGGAGSSSSSEPTIPVIPTVNEFEMLSDSDDDDNSTQQKGNKSDLEADKARQEMLQQCSLPRARDRPPTIHVVDTLASTVDDLLIPPNVQYFIKVTKVAVQVLAVDQKNFDRALEVFKANNIKYFTYDARNTVPVRIVLQGLPEMDIPEVSSELKNFDITAREVKILSKKTTATGTHVLYLLYFDKGTIKIQDLRLVKCLFGYVVNWRYFTKRPTDAAQCHRCQKFGHGSRNCNLPPRCVKCGKEHLTDGCSLPRKATLKDDGNAEHHKPSVKCANCGGNHTANLRGCTTRKLFIEQQEKKKKPSLARQPASSTTKTTAANPPGWGRTYASVAANIQNATPEPSNADNSDLFTMSEFLHLARDMFHRLSSCRNKQQQFMALSELMMKYVCNG